MIKVIIGRDHQEGLIKRGSIPQVNGPTLVGNMNIVKSTRKYRWTSMLSSQIISSLN